MKKEETLTKEEFRIKWFHNPIQVLTADGEKRIQGRRTFESDLNAVIEGEVEELKEKIQFHKGNHNSAKKALNAQMNRGKGLEAELQKLKEEVHEYLKFQSPPTETDSFKRFYPEITKILNDES